MGYKNVCLNCKRVENLGTNLKDSRLGGDCPECSSEMNFVYHAFRPPKKSDVKSWKVAEFLIRNGFIYQHIYQEGKSEYYKTLTDNYVSYPKSMDEAKEFVKKYKHQIKR